MTTQTGGTLCMPRILAIDDDHSILALYKEVFEGAGYRVVCASNGGDGLLMARTEHPDLIVLDIMLPGIGGFELSVLFRQDLLTAHIPILIVSAVGGAFRRAQGFDFGADDFLAKPFDLADLVARAQMALDRVASHAQDKEAAHHDIG